MKRFISFCAAVFVFFQTTMILYGQDECWITKADMSIKRCFMTVAVLGDTIYAIAGSTGEYGATSLVEAYDTTTDHWTYTAILPRPLCGTCGCAVNGKIYIIGGASNVYGAGLVDSVYEYTPATDTWARKSCIPTPLYSASAETVNGKIYVIGGAPVGFDSSFTSVYEYDPAADTWTAKSDMPTARAFGSATAVDGKIYVFGGVPNLNSSGVNTVEAYDPATDTWSVKNPMPDNRAGQASSADDGKVYIFGGSAVRNGYLYPDVLEYNPELDSWVRKANVPTLRVALSACTVGENIYVIGGMDNSNIRLSTVEEYKPALDLTSVEDPENKMDFIKEYNLSQNFPNPFNPTTKINFSVPELSFVTLKVFDVLGSEISTLAKEEKPAGVYELIWNAADLPSGVYFYQLKAGDFIQTKKMILLR